jgi:hypothetical protein
VTDQLSADAERQISYLRRQIAIAQAGLGPIGAEDVPSYLAEFCPWRQRIAAARAEIARIEASIAVENSTKGDNL